VNLKEIENNLRKNEWALTYWSEVVDLHPAAIKNLQHRIFNAEKAIARMRMEMEMQDEKLEELRKYRKRLLREEMAYPLKKKLEALRAKQKELEEEITNSRR